MESLKHRLRQMFDQRNGNDFYDDHRKLAEDIVGKIMNLSILNPSAFHMHDWGIVAVKSQQSRYKLYKILNEDKKVLEAASTLIITDSPGRFNPSLAHMSIMYACKYYGVDFYSFEHGDFHKIKTEFNIAPDREIRMIACLGYFSEFETPCPPVNRICYGDIVREV